MLEDCLLQLVYIIRSTTLNIIIKCRLRNIILDYNADYIIILFVRIQSILSLCHYLTIAYKLVGIFVAPMFVY